MPDIETERGRDAIPLLTLLIKDAQPMPEDLQKAGDWIADRRAMETYSGRDVQGGLFAEYSPDYERRKKEWLVNLYSNKGDTHMLSLVKAQVEKDEVDVGIFGDEEVAARARILNEGGEVPTRYGGFGAKGGKYGPAPRKAVGKKSYSTFPVREWLGATQSDLDHMTEIVGESIEHRVQVHYDSNFGGW